MMAESKTTVEMKKSVENGQSAEVSIKNEVKVVALHSFGGLRSVKVENRAEPSLEKGQVLIRVKAT